MQKVQNRVPDNMTGYREHDPWKKPDHRASIVAMLGSRTSLPHGGRSTYETREIGLALQVGRARTNGSL